MYNIRINNYTRINSLFHVLTTVNLLLPTPYTGSVQKVSSHVIWKIETFIEEDKRYKKHCTWDNGVSVPFKVGTLGPHTVLLVAISCPSYFPESHWWSEISSLSKVILVLGKAISHMAPSLGCSESAGWFDVLSKNCMRRDAWAGALSWWICQSPVAHSCNWITQIVSAEECLSLMQNLLQICCSTQSFWMWCPHSTCTHSRSSTDSTA